ncbi:hypothetical protein DP49_3009 [Burkholderia pseudomallei]|nr:hypothetical protein DP49_3009 [Burkholderia pseudomallei]
MKNSFANPAPGEPWFRFTSTYTYVNVVVVNKPPPILWIT